MELGSSSLSASACNGYGNFTFRKNKAFLSHSGAQKMFVEQLCMDLERCDLKPFFDKSRNSLPIGKDFPRLIFEAIEQSEVGVVVLSEEFFTSKWPMLELVAMANVKKRKPSFKILPVLLGISLSQCRDVYNHKRWLSLWHVWAECDSRIDLKDWANALRLFGPTNVLKYNFELGEVKFREEIVKAICKLVLLETRFEDSHIQRRSHSCKVTHERICASKYDIPKGALYMRPGSDKVEPRIKFPVKRGAGEKSQRIPLGSYNTLADAEVAYQIAAFYCKKPKHTCQLDLGGGAYFPIPALSMDSNLTYEERLKKVKDQVSMVYAKFEERKAPRNLERNLPPSVPGLSFEMPTGEGHLLPTSPIPGPSFEMPTRVGHLLLTSPIQQLGQPLNSGMDSSMQGQGSQLDPSIHNGIDFNDPGCFLPVLAKTQHELLDAHKQIECLKAQVSRMEVENMGWEIKYSELERENGLLNDQIAQSQLQTQHHEQELNPDIFLSMEHEESPTR